MMRNEGPVDRVVRAIVALVAVIGAVAAGADTGLGIGLLVVAAIMAVTAAVGFCPIYRVLGVNTCPLKAKDA